MRGQARQVSHEEEEESAFVSMTDMTVGFLFIIMILLAFFASLAREGQDEDTVSRAKYEAVRTERDELLVLAEVRAKEISRLEEELSTVTAERDALVLELDALTQDLELVRGQLQTAEEELAKLRRRIAELERLEADLREQILEKDRRIEELEEDIRRLEQIDPLETYLSQVAKTRRDVLTRLREAILLDFPELQVELSEESDALRFQGEGLFASGNSELIPEKKEIVARLAQRLNEILPCFTIGDLSQFSAGCNPGFVMIEAVQIEGHTDDVGSDMLNRNLSAARANSTFFEMTNAAPQIMEHQNLKRQPVLSVAAYGPDRPVAPNDTREGRATNRRIDLRFIMVTPRDTDGIAAIRAALETVSMRPR